MEEANFSQTQEHYEPFADDDDEEEVEQEPKRKCKKVFIGEWLYRMLTLL